MTSQTPCERDRWRSHASPTCRTARSLAEMRRAFWPRCATPSRRSEHRRPAEHRRTADPPSTVIVRSVRPVAQGNPSTVERPTRRAPLSGGAERHSAGTAVAGAGILGALLGAASVPQQQPQIIVVVPQPYVPQPPQPTYVSPPSSQRIWWCRTSQRWYPDVGSCADGWTR
jgi:hypothetical protein